MQVMMVGWIELKSIKDTMVFKSKTPEPVEKAEAQAPSILGLVR